MMLFSALAIAPGEEENGHDREELENVDRDEHEIAGRHSINEKEECAKKPDHPGREADAGRFAHAHQFRNLWDVRRQHDKTADEADGRKEEFHRRQSISTENKPVKRIQNEE